MMLAAATLNEISTIPLTILKETSVAAKKNDGTVLSLRPLLIQSGRSELPASIEITPCFTSSTTKNSPNTYPHHCEQVKL